MKDNKEILALIPARSGSKRLPGKNKKLLWGKPLLAYSIETALRSKLIKRVICTTDCLETADIALKYGAEVPFIRPEELSGDRASDTEFYLHALRWLDKNEGYKPDIITNIRPTNPLRIPEIVDDILGTLVSRPDVDSIRTVSRSEHPLFKMRIIDEKTGLIENVVTIPREGPYNVAKYPLPESFLLNTYLDATWVETILKKKLSLGDKMLPYILDETPVDIDTEDDWEKLISKFSSFEDYLSQKTAKK